MKHFETDPTEQKVFWYIFVPGNGEPKEKHYSFQHAKAEAQRIARKTGKETFILQALKSYVVNDIEERNFMHEPNRKGKGKVVELSREELIDFIHKPKNNTEEKHNWNMLIDILK